MLERASNSEILEGARLLEISGIRIADMMKMAFLKTH